MYLSHHKSFENEMEKGVKMAKQLQHLQIDIHFNLQSLCWPMFKLTFVQSWLVIADSSSVNSS